MRLKRYVKTSISTNTELSLNLSRSKLNIKDKRTMSIRAHILAVLYLCKLKRKIVKQICIPNSSTSDQSPIRIKKEVKRNSLTLLEEIPWDIDIVKKSFLIHVNDKSKKEAESLLLDQYVDGFDATNGTFLVRLDANKELKNVDVILSLVYDGKILHEKIKMMKYFNRYSFCLENGAIIFHSISALIKYHNLNVALPLPCLLKEKVNYEL